MSLLAIIQNGLKKNELSKMQKSLMEKRGEIQKQINHRVTDIATMRDEDEIDLPIIKMNAEEKLNKTLVDPTATSKELLAAWLENENALNLDTISNPKIKQYEDELAPLKRLFNAFPTIDQIKKLNK